MAQAAQDRTSRDRWFGRITWAAVRARCYNVYKALPVEQRHGSSWRALRLHDDCQLALTAVDTNIVPDFTFAPPTHQNPFAGNNPIAVTYDQQRKVYAGSNASPRPSGCPSRASSKTSMCRSPVQPSDAITGTWSRARLTISSIWSPCRAA
jgi:hypothetical protein